MNVKKLLAGTLKNRNNNDDVIDVNVNNVGVDLDYEDSVSSISEIHSRSSACDRSIHHDKEQQQHDFDENDNMIHTQRRVTYENIELDNNINSETEEEIKEIDEDDEAEALEQSQEEGNEEEGQQEQAVTRQREIDTETQEENEQSPLCKSSLLKGYFALSVLSCLAFVAAYESDKRHHFFNNTILKPDIVVPGTMALVVPAGPTGRYYALVASGVSAILNAIITILHYLDRLCLKRRLRRMFRNGSPIECSIIIFGIIWWIVGTAIITSIRGPAGDGRGQFNLYFSTWLCCITNIILFETWLEAAGYSSIRESIATWPNQAPGWIMIFTCTFANLMCIIDLYSKHDDIQIYVPLIALKYASISSAQWGWLIFVCALSMVTACGFSLIELFRWNKDEPNAKGSFESKFEGIVLAFLVCIWLPSIVIATTDGAASDFGNTYFFTWGSGSIVIQTFINWLQDWRKAVHEANARLRLEYEQSKLRTKESISIRDEEE
mmetsp:Transcript_6946/g.7589  ORF Transcript_6946/g.7589 Transcript_6946/m.7589 type:complete len:494 (+) Transcript_6946:129-1610(+)